MNIDFNQKANMQERAKIAIINFSLVFKGIMKINYFKITSIFNSTEIKVQLSKEILEKSTP